MPVMKNGNTPHTYAEIIATATAMKKNKLGARHPRYASMVSPYANNNTVDKSQVSNSMSKLSGASNTSILEKF
jgi:hypothetical protein